MRSSVPFRFFLLPLCVAVMVLLHAGGVQAQTVTQTVSFQPGWNTLWLEVQPNDPDPAAIFAGLPVDMVTTFIPLAAKYTSLRDPNSDTWKDPEWRIWQPGEQAGAFLNNLHQMQAGQGYLVKTSASATVVLSGSAVFSRLRWLPQAFNLVGLPVDAASSITLGTFFANSPAHTPLRAFKLLNGKWVQAASGEPAQAGRAYWIWCGTGSDHQGPVAMRLSDSGLTLNTSDSQASVEFRPSGNAALSMTLNSSGSVPLARLTSSGRLAAAAPFSIIAQAQQWTPVRLGLLDPSAPPVAGASILEIRTAGLLWRVPVSSNP